MTTTRTHTTYTTSTGRTISIKLPTRIGRAIVTRCARCGSTATMCLCRTHKH